MNPSRHFEASPSSRKAALALVAIGAAAAVFGVYREPDRAWPSLLLNSFYGATLSVSAMFFLATQRLTGARWSAGLRRIPEALMLALPPFAILLLIVLLGRQSLYPWSRPGAFADAPRIAGKVQYLQQGFVFARMTVTLILWTGFTWLFRKTSLEQDDKPQFALRYHHLLNRYAAVFALVFAISFSTAAFDWIASLDPSWFSTMFALYTFCGVFVQGIAAVTLAVVLLHQGGFLGNSVRENQLHDLGKMLFAFSTFWAYIWVCQYLLIWYGDIPEEVTHYVRRTSPAWLPLFLANFAVNWIVPFLTLLPAQNKRNPAILRAMCVLLLCGHWLDLYLLITPAMSSAPVLGPIEILIPAGSVALLYLLFVRNLGDAHLVPLHDPVLGAESADGTIGWMQGVEQ